MIRTIDILSIAERFNFRVQLFERVEQPETPRGGGCSAAYTLALGGPGGCSAAYTLALGGGGAGGALQRTHWNRVEDPRDGDDERKFSHVF